MSRSGVTVSVSNLAPQMIARNNSVMFKAVQDCVLDLSNTAKGSAPHFKGRLEKGITHSMLKSSQYIEGTVGVSAREKGFDYGEFRHDKPFNLGEKSRAKNGGRSGISGKSFSVGDGFISNPARENEQAYVNYIQEKFNREICD